MSYENFITKLLNVNPSNMLSVTTSSKENITIILKVRLKIKDPYFPICNIYSKIRRYYKMALTHSTLVNRKCIIVYEQRRFKCPECDYTFTEYNKRELIVNSFTLINGKRINNSYMESKNRVVGRLIFNANRFKNFRRTQNRILHCLNPNDTFRM